MFVSLTTAALLGGAGSEETTSLGTLVDCWYVEEVTGYTGSFARGVSQKKAMVLLRDDVQHIKALDFTVPQDVEAGLLFDVIDPTRRLLNPKLRQQQASEKRVASFCEVSPFKPQVAFVDWALSLTPEQQSPLDLGGAWYISNLQNPQKTFSISSIHREVPGPEGQKGQAKSTMVALNIFTNTPKIAARLGSKVVLDCAFSAVKGDRFSVEWRYQFQGSGDVVYAYDGVTDRILVAQEGAEIFFQEMHRHGNASLLLHDVSVKHEGTYICIVYTPYLHVQQAVELRIAEPPRVTLHPDPLYVVPGRDQVLECEAAAYYPLDVTVEWLRRNGTAGEVEYLTSSWQSNHRASPDGTFTVSSYVRVWGDPKEHGALYTCYVSHSALKTGAKKSLRLSVAGESGPSMEDTIGLFITAFILCGLLSFISTKVSPWLSPSAGDAQPVDQKAKAE
ncbi:tapasin isoform X2 [Pleurodeles waltl]|uniref:tapasin isoform X2 n=1 Tax=Pleurodeles waltl TaxID=8319 RepID=UPI0037097BB0